MQEQESLINSEQETKDEVGEVNERPEWLPEKFFKEGKPDYEGLAKSYTEAETYIGKKKEDLTAEIRTQIEEEQTKVYLKQQISMFYQKFLIIMIQIHHLWMAGKSIVLIIN